MDAVSVESINKLLALNDKLRDLESRFNYGFDMVRSDATLVRNNSRQRYEEICNQRDQAAEEVDDCKNELERIRDERNYLRQCRDDYDPDDFEREMGYLDDDYDDAKEKLDDAKKELEKMEARKSQAHQHCEVIERWSERILFLSDSKIINDFRECKSFIERYGSYLADMMKGV